MHTKLPQSDLHQIQLQNYNIYLYSKGLLCDFLLYIFIYLQIRILVLTSTKANHLNQTFSGRWIGNCGEGVKWPARTPDLNPLDFFFCLA